MAEHKEQKGKPQQKPVVPQKPIATSQPQNVDANFKYIVRVANADLDGNKPVGHALTKIKGVSFMIANALCFIASIDMKKKSGVLTDSEVAKLNDILHNPLAYKLPVWMMNRRFDPEDGTNKHLLASDLDFQKQTDVRNMQRIKTYKGIRHGLGLPVRGQRTKSNFRRNKGKSSLGVQKKKTAPAASDKKKDKK